LTPDTNKVKEPDMAIYQNRTFSDSNLKRSHFSTKSRSLLLSALTYSYLNWSLLYTKVASKVLYNITYKTNIVDEEHLIRQEAQACHHSSSYPFGD